MAMGRDKLVYLAGPISGETGEHRPWRDEFKARLKADIRCLSPLRDEIDRTADYPMTIEKLRHGKGCVARDRMDIMRCDLIVANFLGSRRVSIGSVGEVFWADAYRKPIIIVMEEGQAGNPHFHLFILELASWMFTSLEDAAEKANVILSDL